MTDLSKTVSSIGRRLAKYAIQTWTGFDSGIIDSAEQITDHINGMFSHDISYIEAQSIELEYIHLSEAFSRNLQLLQREGEIKRHVSDYLNKASGIQNGKFGIDPLALSQGIKDETIAAFTAVDLSLKATKFSLKDIVENRLEPLPLEQRILSDNSSLFSTLNEPAKQLYFKTIRDCCQLLVSFAAKMPDFSLMTLRAVITGQDDLASKVDQIAKDIANVIASSKMKERQDGASGTTNFHLQLKFRDFETRLKMNIARNMRFIELFGVNVDDSVKRYQLPTSYIHLDAQLVASTGMQEQDKGIIEILQGGSRFLIRGEAGTGKRLYYSG